MSIDVCGEGRGKEGAGDEAEKGHTDAEKGISTIRIQQKYRENHAGQDGNTQSEVGSQRRMA